MAPAASLTALLTPAFQTPPPFLLARSITSATHPYDAYDNSPVHRFYQMWQQVDCDVTRSTPWNPTGCQHDLFPWVETTVGAGTKGLPQSALTFMTFS